MNAHLVFVDDNPRFLDAFLTQIGNIAANIDVTLIESATAFVEQLNQLEASPPHVFVLDMMLIDKKMADGEQLLPGYSAYEGGLWIASKIRSSNTLASVPILFLSTLAPTALQELVQRVFPEAARQSIYYASNADAAETVARKVLALASATVELVAPTKSTPRTMLEAFELKPGLFGVKVDLKKLFGLSPK